MSCSPQKNELTLYFSFIIIPCIKKKNIYTFRTVLYKLCVFFSLFSYHPLFLFSIVCMKHFHLYYFFPSTFHYYDYWVFFLLYPTFCIIFWITKISKAYERINMPFSIFSIYIFFSSCYGTAFSLASFTTFESIFKVEKKKKKRHVL